MNASLFPVFDSVRRLCGDFSIHLAQRLILVAVTSALLGGCASTPPQREAPPSPPPLPLAVEKHQFSVAGDESVVGQLASVETRDGDTLSDIARHYGLGFQELTEANPGLDPWVPEAGRRLVLPLQFTLPDAPRKGMVINLATMRLYHFPTKGADGTVSTYPVGIGKEGRSTPTGYMTVVRKTEFPTWYPTENIRKDHALKGDPLPAAVSPGPDNPLGDYAMYLSRPQYLIHGTNKPYSIGFRASNGCIRLYPEDIAAVFPVVKPGAAVRVVNQPYLIGRKSGQIYLEAHEPYEELNRGRLKAELTARLKRLEKKEGVVLDWSRVEQVLAEARGIPVPIQANSPPMAAVVAQAIELRRPAAWLGRPEPPAEDAGGWMVKAAATREELSARRVAAVLNHQGPPIPARAVKAGDGFEVLAGPFKDGKAAKNAARRLKIDLELDAEVRPPADSVRVAGGAKPLARVGRP
ncbi:MULTISPECIES: L,D-transpeptidase family protein [Methylococcus]|uniref:L,D-transpeptidase family protein n=1 Tax=Methylococcus capsulatus TaxID=414 RepID=A0ABZ2F5B8_METCP|nr:MULTISPECIES: L,D-transpeptidase family protein [Methylococcus]MDF9390945.1 LysM peptidoglycan-binding domain-containing protein [Methylococcus capsulatus]